MLARCRRVPSVAVGSAPTRARYASVIPTAMGIDAMKAQAQARRLPPTIIYKRFMRALQWSVRTEEVHRISLRHLTPKLTPNHVAAMKSLWRAKSVDPEAHKRRLDIAWKLIDGVMQEQARFFSIKEELVPGRSGDDDFLNKYKHKNSKEAEEDVEPLPKEDLPEQLQKFIEKRSVETKPPTDPAKAIEGTLKRLKAKVIDNNRDVEPLERRQPPRAVIPKGMSSRSISLHEALQHLQATADPNALPVPPQRRVASILDLGNERLSKI